MRPGWCFSSDFSTIAQPLEDILRDTIAFEVRFAGSTLGDKDIKPDSTELGVKTATIDTGGLGGSGNSLVFNLAVFKAGV